MIFHHIWMEYDGITTVFQDIPVSFNYNHFTDSMMPWSGYSPVAGPKPSAPPADYGAVELGAKDEGGLGIWDGEAAPISMGRGWYKWVCLKMLCTPLYPMVLLIMIPFLNGYNWEYTLFSDKHSNWTWP